MEAEHSVDVACTPSQLMRVLWDFESYPEFLPRMKRARIALQDGDQVEVDFRLEFVRALDYTLRLQREPLRLEWTLVRGFFRRNEGSWTLEPTDGGVRAHYSIALQPNGTVPRALLNSLLRHELPQMLAAFKARAELLTSADLLGGSAPADG